jgi:Family of unknown function (DUF6636)
VRRIAIPGTVLVALVMITAPSSAFELTQVHTPDGNIGCALIAGKGSRGGEARCDIRRHSWPTPKKPASCELDYGSGLVVGAHGRATFVCAGDTTLNQGTTLPVRGRGVGVGPYRCDNLGDAVRCINRKTGHGFKLSRTVAKRF